jgi:hypothetical protein
MPIEKKLVPYQSLLVTYMSSKLLNLLNESRESLMELLAKILKTHKEKYTCCNLDNDCYFAYARAKIAQFRDIIR